MDFKHGETYLVKSAVARIGAEDEEERESRSGKGEGEIGNVEKRSPIGQ